MTIHYPLLTQVDKSTSAIDPVVKPRFGNETFLPLYSLRDAQLKQPNIPSLILIGCGRNILN